MSEDKNIKRYRVIVIHQPIQFLVKTDKVGKELNQEVSEMVMKTKAFPAEIICSEIKNARPIVVDKRVKKKKND